MLTLNKFKINFITLISYFGITKKAFEELDDSLNQYPQDLYYDIIYPQLKRDFRRKQVNLIYKFDLFSNCGNADYDYFVEHIEQNKSLIEAIVSEIEDYINNTVGNEYDAESFQQIDLTVNKKNNDEIFVELHGDPDSLVRKGMNAYGLFEYDLHSEEDKESLCADFEIILREMCHYYEACNGSKPKLKYNFDWEHFYHFKINDDDIIEYLEKEFFEGRLTARLNLCKEDFQKVYDKYGFDVTVQQLKELLPNFEIEHGDTPVFAKVEIHV